MGELTDAIYEEYEPDLQAVKAALAAHGLTLKSMSKKWRRQRIRRRIRRGQAIESRIREIIAKYTPMICPVTLESPINEELAEVHQNACKPTIATPHGMQSPIAMLEGGHTVTWVLVVL